MEAKRIRWIVWVLFFLSFEIIDASVVILKNGDIYTGELKTEKPKSYVFNSRFGELSVNKVDVENIIWSEKSIKLEEFKVDQKTMKGRVVRSTKNETAFLTEDGKIVRVKKKAQPAPVKKPLPTKLLPFYIGLAPTAGISKVRTIKFKEGIIHPDTVSAPNTFGVQLGLGYQLFGPVLAARLELGFALTQHKSTASGPPPENAPGPDPPDNEFNGSFTQTKESAAVDVQFFFNRIFLAPDHLLSGFYVTAGGGMALSQVEMKVKDFGGLDDLVIDWKGSKAFPFVQASLGWMFPITRRLALDVAAGGQYEFLQSPYDDFKIPGDIDPNQRPAAEDLVESLAIEQNNPLNLFVRIGVAYRF